MAKIWRRKKGGKYVGGWYVTKGKKPVNLRTKDANLARKRGAQALAGKWPPAADDEAAAAKSAAASLEVEADDVEPEPAPPEPPKESQKTEAHTTAPTPAVNAPSGSAGSPDADVMAAAVAAAGGDEPSSDEEALPPEEEAKRAEWRARVEQLFGTGGAGGMTPGKAMATGTMLIEGVTFQALGESMKPPRYLHFDAQKVGVLVEMLALGWDEQLRRWGVGLGQMEPWKAILAGTIGLAGAMVVTLNKEPPPADDPNDPSVAARRENAAASNGQ